MELSYREAMRLIDRIYARHAKGPFPVSDPSGHLSSDAAQQLCDLGLIVLHASRVLPQACDLTFRAVPALDSDAPYRLVPMVSSTARWRTVWSGTLTEDALVQVYRPLAPRTESRVPRPRTPLLVPTMSAQTTLDGGSWAPEQTTLVEMLAELATPAPVVRRRRSVFSPPFIPDDQLRAPILSGGDLPGWALGAGGRLLPATLVVLQYDDGPILADQRSPATAVSGGLDCLWFSVVEECSLDDAIEVFDLPRRFPWRIIDRYPHPTARFRSADGARDWDFVLRLPQGAVICDAPASE